MTKLLFALGLIFIADNTALARGVTVEATIHQTEPGQVVSVDLFKLRNQGRQPGALIQTLTLAKSDAMSRSVRFENVEPGPYLIFANGARPSQHAGQRVVVQEWDVSPVNVQLTPLNFEIPRLEVVGHVIDAETGAPIPNAGVALEHDHLSVSAKADDEGAFRFAPVFPGEHTIRVASSEYPVSETIYTFGDDEESRSLTIALHRTPMTRLSVVNAHGLPVTGAKVFVFAGDAVTMAVGRTDATGQAPVFIPEGATHNVFVVPRDGSLGATRIKSGTRNAQMILGEGSSRIVVRAESESHEPIPGISLDVRYNGFLLPIEVMQALTARGSRTASDAEGRMVLNHMPAGTYELWPVPGNAGSAPVRMIATPGENLATLTYTRR